MFYSIWNKFSFFFCLRHFWYLNIIVYFTTDTFNIGWFHLKYIWFWTFSPSRTFLLFRAFFRDHLYLGHFCRLDTVCMIVSYQVSYASSIFIIHILFTGIITRVLNYYVLILNGSWIINFQVMCIIIYMYIYIIKYLFVSFRVKVEGVYYNILIITYYLLITMHSNIVQRCVF